MKFKLISRTLAFAAAVIITLDFFLATTFAQGTAFTYQGRLNDGASSARGIYDVRFAIYDALTLGTQQGSILTNAATAVSNGLFTVTLDFGNQFPGANRWLEIGVRTNGSGAFFPLTPRQPLTPTPYAIQAGNAATATSAGSAGFVLAVNITGALTPAQLPAGLITNGASGVNISGTFTGDGAGVTNVNLTANSGGAIAWPGDFALGSFLFLAVAPYSVVAADVNGDGKPDLISANFLAGSLSVWTNNGSGGFAGFISLGVGSGPYSVVAADVNGDGKLDLISANYNDNTLTVWTNNGSGGFGLASSPTVGSLPRSVTSADVNGDGKMDLISANAGNATLSVLTNDGNNNFVLSSSPGVSGLGPVSVTAADVNGDGKVDLISANLSGNNLTVLTNNGSGGFVIASSPSVGGSPQSVVAADVNGDGKVDLISANFAGNTLSVLTNNGSGGFVLASTPAVGNGPYSVTAADVNGDGKVDLISANQNANTLTVLTNNGSGGFVIASSPGVGNTPYGVAAADVNGDGKVDLISANQAATTLWVMLNTPTFSGNFGGSFSGNFNGNGAGLSSLSAINLIGSVPTASLSSVPAANLFGSVPSAALTSVPAGSLTGTIVDTRLSANVALRSGGNALTGNQSIAGTLGIGTTSAQGSLHVYSPNNPTVVRLQSSGTPGFGRLEFVSNPQGDINEWRPSYIQSTDSGGFTGGLAFFVNGTGAGNKFGSNEVMRVVNGAVGIGTTAPVSALQVVGTVTATAFNPPSDRNLKENFVAVSPRDVLNKVAAMPISRWNFIGDTATPHVGPMAQDFHAAFGLGTDERHIATVDADGVALAAIQGLNQKFEEQRAENAELKQQVAELKQLVQTLVAKH